jgi:hypothetical protein
MPMRHMLWPLLSVLPLTVSCATAPSSPPAATRAWADSLPGPRLTWDELVRAVNKESDELEAEGRRRHEIRKPQEMPGGGRRVTVYRACDSIAVVNLSCDHYIETSKGWVGPFRKCGYDAEEGPCGLLEDGTPIWEECVSNGGGHYSRAYMVIDSHGEWLKLASFDFTVGEEGFREVFYQAAIRNKAPTPGYFKFINHPITQSWLKRWDFLTHWYCVSAEPDGKRILIAVENDNQSPDGGEPRLYYARRWLFDPDVGYVLLEESVVKADDAKQWVNWLHESEQRKITQADWEWLIKRAVKEWIVWPEGNVVEYPRLR